MLCHNIAELFQKEITKAFIIFIFADTFDFRSTEEAKGEEVGVIFALNISTVENDSKTPVGNHRLTVSNTLCHKFSGLGWDDWID